MSTAPRGGWAFEHRVATAGELHEPWPGDPTGAGVDRMAALCTVTRPAIVLGSTQQRTTVDTARAAALGIDVTRRGSGGGAVLVAPGAQVWFDAWISRHDVLWEDDVLRSSAWLGRLWARVLEALGMHNADVHVGRAAADASSRLVCFAGLGPGELSTGGVKVVGVSQRRTRHGARFSSVAMVSWDPAAVVDLLAPAARGVLGPADRLAASATGLRHALPSLARHTDEGIVSLVGNALLDALR
ncbi:MAG: hypothetical protein ABSG81_08375 [Acidimicrobiales bacterium]